MSGSPTPPRSTGSPAGSPAGPTDGGAAALGDPEVRRFLRDYVKKRVGPDDVDDVVQTVLVDALASAKRPHETAEVRKWLVGIARHKCADHHRRSGRERPAVDELPELPAAPPPVEERALVRWAEEQAQSSREAGKTLGWMAREGEGDKLEHIADEEALPPARVRQRVSRMRRLLKERWLAELALVAALGAVALVLWKWLKKDDGPIVAEPTPPKTAAPVEPERVAEGRRLRGEALEVCRAGEHQRCLDDLDRARELDPTGDAADDVRQARERAATALEAERSKAPDPVQQKSVAPEPSSPPTTAPVPPPAPKPNAPKSEPPPSKTPPVDSEPTAPLPQQTQAPVPTAPPPKGFPSKKAPSKGSFDSDFDTKKKKAPPGAS